MFLIVVDVVKRSPERFREFDINTDTLDTFYVTVMDRSKFPQLSSVVRRLLLLSHGQAADESGFSTNKYVSDWNMKEDSLSAMRQVFSGVKEAGGPSQVKITPKLMGNVNAAHGRYTTFLNAQKAAKKESEKTAAQKERQDVIEKLMARIASLKTDQKHLQEKSVKLAENAEKLTSASAQNKVFKESKVLRRDAAAMTEELIAAELQLEELKNEKNEVFKSVKINLIDYFCFNVFLLNF